MPTAKLCAVAVLALMPALVGGAAAQQVGKVPPAFPPETAPPQMTPPQTASPQMASPHKGVTIPPPRPAGKLLLRTFTLRCADATKLAKVLTDFLQDPRRPLLVAVYAETNTLLVQASPEDMELIELLIVRLENPPR